MHLRDDVAHHIEIIAQKIHNARFTMQGYVVNVDGLHFVMKMPICKDLSSSRISLPRHDETAA